MNIILSGPPGCGKGTQAELLIAKTGMTHYSTGDVFRSHIKRQTPIGSKVLAYVNAGKLVPDEIVLEVAQEFLCANPDKDILFDGFPRTIPQAEGLDRILKESDRQIDVAVFIDLADDIIVQRLTSRRVCRQCGAIFNLEFKPPAKPGICDDCGGELYQRADDNEQTIRNRLRVYQQETTGLKDYYQRAGKLVVLNGTIGKERLHQAIMELSNRKDDARDSGR